MENNSRFIAFVIIKDLLNYNKSHNRLLEDNLYTGLGSKDRNLLMHITKGVFRNKYFLDENINFYSKNKKIDNVTLSLLYLGSFQILLCDFIPNYAAVNTTMDIASKKSKKSKTFINAILRKISNNSISFNKRTQSHKLLDCPEWLYDKLIEDHDKDSVEKYLKIARSKPKIWIRVNTLRTTLQDIVCILKDNNIDFDFSSPIDNFVSVDKFDKNHIIMDNIKSGLLYIQNPSSGFVIKYLNPQPYEEILDTCSAPGGKVSYIAQETNNKAKITCIDNDKKRMKILEHNIKTLHIDNIDLVNSDSSKILLNKQYDKILLDPPCSSSGTFQKNPDVKWKLNEKLVSLFRETQLNILCNISKYLKVNGQLLYSTCSLFKDENEYNIIEFLKINRNFSIMKAHDSLLCNFKNKFGGITIMPDSNNYEGMFAIKLIKNEENNS